MFFKKKDSEQQGLDINIGRVLEMFQTGVLSLEATREAVAKFFGGEAQKDLTGLNDILTRILTRIHAGALDCNKARSGLVNAAAASEHHDPHYIDRLQALLD
jgi:hypothetical protein